MPVCTSPGCPELVPRHGYCEDCRRVRDRARNADPKRKKLYDGPWARHSRERRQEQPFCSMLDGTCSSDLTVDHPTDEVLCRSHHNRLEARRRADVRTSG